jgi:polyisoprenoid-binding protein YceI
MSFIHRGRIAFALMPLVVLLAGCPTRPRDTGPSTTSRPIASIPQGEGQAYDIVPAESLLTVQVYRGGAMARMGHNHVIASHDLTGKVFLNREDIARSSFQVQFPVASLTVDEPELRAEAGEDFPPGVPDSAKEGTKRNLLSDALLDGASYPSITLASGPLEAVSDRALNAQVQVTVRDQTRTIAVPVAYEWKEGQLTASGELPLKQSEVGLKPFSVMMGALEVKDDMKVRFRIVAKAAPPAP